MGCSSSKPSADAVIEHPNPVAPVAPKTPAASKPEVATSTPAAVVEVVDPKVVALHIQSARVGDADVTDAIKKAVKDNSLTIKGGYRNVVSGEGKLELSYFYESGFIHQIVKDGETVVVEAPKGTLLHVQNATCGAVDHRVLFTNLIQHSTTLSIHNSSSEYGGKDIDIHYFYTSRPLVQEFGADEDVFLPSFVHAIFPEPEPEVIEDIEVVSTPEQVEMPAPSQEVHVTDASGASTIPALMRGYINKEGGTRKNWNNRYFVLESTASSSRVTYYVASLDMPPYGKDKKGELDLKGYEVECQGDIVILNGGSAKRLFKMEIKDVSYRIKWVNAFREHIEYANTLP